MALAIPNKNASAKEAQTISSDIIIRGKTYNVKALEPFFTRSALRFADKAKLYELWHIAVESGIKQFITNVDNAFNEQYPNYE